MAAIQLSKNNDKVKKRILENYFNYFKINLDFLLI